MRSQTNPVAQVEVTEAVQPLAPTVQDCRLFPERQIAPAAQASVQHEALPAWPWQVPVVHVETAD
jgi:hypothetical protein